MFVYPPHKQSRTTVRGIKGKITAVHGGFFLIAWAFGGFAQASVNVNLAWDPSIATNIAGYHLHQGTASQTYTDSIDVGNVTNATVSGLVTGVTYYFAVSAYDTHGLESTLSNEISYTPSVSTNSSPPVVLMTAPSNGAAYVAPANITLAATVTPNGHTITQVQFHNGASLLGSSSSAPYGFAWNNVGAGSYSLSATVVYDAGSTVGSSPVGVSVASPVTNSPPISLPAPWQAIDIGSAAIAGTSVDSNGVFVVSGAGALSGTSDSFRFVYQPLSGDGQIAVQLSSLQNVGANACAGVMIRESLTPGSRYALMSLSSGDNYLWQRRSKTSFKTWSNSAGSGTPPQSWVRVVRSGSFFTGYGSSDGVNWTQVSSANISMATNIYIGLAVASGSTNVLTTSSFSGLNVMP